MMQSKLSGGKEYKTVPVATILEKLEPGMENTSKRDSNDFGRQRNLSP
jgi:hypothetical protein